MLLSSSSLTSLKCANFHSQSFDNSPSISVAFEWLAFVFTSPCPQRILYSSIDLLFVITILVFLVTKIYSRFTSDDNSSSNLNKPLLGNNRIQAKTTIWFNLSLLVSVLLALANTVLCILAFSQSSQTSWKVTEFLFRLAQAVANVVIVLLMVHEKKFEAVTHPVSLRLYWMASFVLVCFFSATAITRFVSPNKDIDPNLRLDDIFSLGSFPLCAFLCIVAIQGSSGIQSHSGVISTDFEQNVEDANVSGYASASLFSRASWYWMNPLITKGYKNPLKVEDVPSLPQDHQAQRMSELFEKNWPKPSENSNHPVRTTLLRCFWKRLVFTGFLAVLKLIVMYVGPVLIQDFVDFTSGKRSSPYQGYYLVLTLLIAKSIEVISSHQFNFQSQRVGMLIRSSLITSLYKKSLRLSCSARQAHGVGQIVNHMAVDAQQLSDLMMQVHALWMMPFQVGVALALIYGYLGASMLAALAITIATSIFTLMRTWRNNIFMYGVMRNRDVRMKATNETLGNMRVVKFQAWEEHFRKRILSAREEEYKWLSKFMYSSSLNMVVLWSAPTIIAALTFTAAILLGYSLDAGTVFTATTVFRILQEPIRSFPQALTAISQAIISLGRLDRYMMSGEVEEGSVEREEGCGGSIAVEVRGGNFSWDTEGKEGVLRDLNICIEKGELAAIVGTVGSGKSSLLSSILGEMHKISGKVRVCGSTAYVAQTSWIQNGTIQENILFGLPLNKERYKEVIRVCCLEKDFEIMEFGDQTEIGERGINLSGGQKQRIQLARAVYQDCDIYLLDDVFSAVDAQTGSEIFKECVRGMLRNKTVLLVTHQVDFLHNVDVILVMRDGIIVQSGKYEGLLHAGMDFGALVAAHENSMELVGVDSTNLGDNPGQSPKSPHNSSIQGETNGENKSIERSNSGKHSSKLIEEEERETGRVSLQVYKDYCTEAYGWWGVVAVIIMSLTWQATLMSGDYWLAYETADGRTFVPSVFIYVYWIIAVLSCVFVIIRAVFVARVGLVTAQSFFKQIVYSIMRAPMSFFDTTPSGRILSRASTDQTNIDIFIPFFFATTIMMYFTLLSIIFITCLYAWPTVFLLIPLGWLNMWYRGYYLATSREITRLDAITKAPVIHHFSETVTGVTTIRCFRNQSRFCKENIDRVNTNLKMDFHNNGSNEWLGFRLELLGSFLLCFAALFMVTLPSSIIKPEYVGLSLSYGLSLNGVLFWTVYMTCFVENRMVSVERIKQFINIPSEAPWKISNCLPSPDWPSHGDIELKHLQVRYRPNTPLVLKGLTLNIQGGEKIGVVGRTGSGKSTLIQVFFRLIEPSSGKIIVDGVDICKLGLHDLRSRFGIIPQEPVLFEGTVRSNIDPIGLYSDEEIWKSLDRCQLKDVVAAKPEKLGASVADGGDNWSVGQRQLLCLGRVLLKRSQILFMDEATASVDSQTDAVIQKIIREDFASCTIISIAHRIPTVMDCDRVLVIDAGLAKEFDSPSRLLERPSVFGALVQEYANRSIGF